MESLAITIATAIASFSGAWAIVRHKTEASAESIKELRTLANADEARISMMATDIAVLRSRADGGDRRLTESLAAIEKTVEQSEQRVIAHVDALVQAFRRSRDD